MEIESRKLYFGFDFNGNIEGEFGHAYGTARMPACFRAVEFQDEVRDPVDHGGLKVEPGGGNIRPSDRSIFSMLAMSSLRMTLNYSDATATDLRPGLGFGHRSLIQFRMVISE
jgi:hypothetical protein